MADLLEVSGDNANGEGLLLSRELDQNDVYTAGPNIQITPKTTSITEDVEFTTYEISGKDWSTAIQSAVSGKQDKLDFGYRDEKISSINDSAIYYEPSNSWKQWSEENGSSGVEDNIYIGKDNSGDAQGINIGANNNILDGDETIGASINLGKNLTNRMGVLIGQDIESKGYGFGIGSNIDYVDNGDFIAGYNIETNKDDERRYASRVIVGKDISGSFRTENTIIGQKISAYSGQIPNRDYEGFGGENGNTVIGEDIMIAAGAGSITLAHNGYGSNLDSANNPVPLYVMHDSNLIGGYSNFEKDNYVNPGIYADYNGTIIGQGQQISAFNDATVIGAQSIASGGSKVFGNHSIARDNSVAINETVMSYENVTIKNAPHINDTLIKDSSKLTPLYKNRISTYNNVRAFAYIPATNTSVSGIKILNYLYGENTDSYSDTDHYFNESIDKTCATAVFNIQRDPFKIVSGTWSEDGKTFTEDSTKSTTAYKITAWEGTPFILINENGTKTFYDYSSLTPAQKEALPKYYKVRNDIYGNNRYNQLYVSNGEYIYCLSNNHNLNPSITSIIPSALIDNTNHVAVDVNNQSVYLYEDGTVAVGADLPSAYSYEGETATNITFKDVSIAPSSLLDMNQLITNTTAENGSLAFGSRISATNGSIGLNVTDKFVNENKSTITTHRFTTTTNYVSIKGLGPNGVVQSATTYSGKLENRDATVFSDAASISIGLGSYADVNGLYPYSNTGNYAKYNSLAVGINSSATSGSIVIGSNASADIDSVFIGMKGYRSVIKRRSIGIGENNNAEGLSYIYGFNSSAYGLGFTFGFQNTAYGLAFAMGYNSFASGNAIGIGQQVTAQEQSYGFGWNITADDNSVALGQQQCARNQSIAIGFKGGYGIYGNRDSYFGNYAAELALALGFQNYSYKNSYAIGFNNVAKELGWTYGFNNYIWGFGMALGFGNCDWVASGSESKVQECVDMFGRWNTVVGTINNLTAGNNSVPYETTIVGNNNLLYITSSDFKRTSTAYQFAGIFLGKQNECYMANPGGYNIYLGQRNKGAQEVINIGRDNDTIGHSISLGWQNRAIKGGYPHAVIIGYNNSAENDKAQLYDKPVNAVSFIHYTDEEINEAYNYITANGQEFLALTAAIYNNLSNYMSNNDINKFINYTIGNDFYWVVYEEEKPISSWENDTVYQSLSGTVSSVINYEQQQFNYYYNSLSDYSFADALTGGNLIYISYNPNKTFIGVNTDYGDYIIYYSQGYYNPKYYLCYNTNTRNHSAEYGQIDGWISESNFNAFNSNYNYYSANAPQVLNINWYQLYSKYKPISSYYLTFAKATTVNNTYSYSATSASPETQSFIVGSNNKADHYNSILIGSENRSLSAITNPNTDDGFVIGIGLNNIVARNYDMAIGYGAIASGGENLVIGSTQTDDRGKNPTATQAIGYANFALRSNLTGTRNYAVDSVLNVSYNAPYSEYTIFDQITKNKLFNSNIVGTVGTYGMNGNTLNFVSGYKINNAGSFNKNIFNWVEMSYPQEEIINIGGQWNSNIIHMVDNIIISGANFVNNNIIANSTGISAIVYNGPFSTNIINNTEISGEFGTSFANNLLFNSRISGEDYSQFSHNVMFNTVATSTHGTFSYSDGGGHILDTIGSVNFGPNNIEKCISITNIGKENVLCNISQSFVLGNQNTACGGELDEYEAGTDYCISHTYMLGNSNYIHSDYNSTTFTRNFVFGNRNEVASYMSLTDTMVLGNDNTVSSDYYGDCFARNRVMGSKNSIYAKGEVYDNTLFGNKNLLALVNNIPSKTAMLYNDLGGDTPCDSKSGTFASNRNYIFGNQNVISQYINDSHIAGHGNMIVATDLSNSATDKVRGKFDNNVILGNANISYDGSKQFIVGELNNVSGHFAYALGKELSAQDFQTIIGKYNTPVDGTTRSTSAYENGAVVELPNSGVLFAIGNGRLNAYQYEGNWYDVNGTKINEADENNITRSNAMLVSADGTVSAGDFETSGGYKLSDISAVIELMNNKPATGSKYIIGLDENGNLTWVNVTV